MPYSYSQPIHYNLATLNSLEEFDNMIAGLKMELEKVTTLRNNYTPINRRLPAEILCEIFSQLAKDCRDEYKISMLLFRGPYSRRQQWPDPYAWVTVTHVCRQWRNIALNSPSLWTSISNKQPDYLHAFIQRSRQAPLEIRAHYNDVKYASGALGLLLPERHRWRKFECSVPILEWDDLSDAPKLEVLQLRGPFQPLTPATSSSFELPRLRRVEVDTAPFSFAEGLVKRDSITRLFLANITPHQSLATWLAVLGLLPSLEELNLVQVFLPSSHPLPSSHRISFRNLQYLHLAEADDGRAAANFLEMVTIPPSTRLSLEERVPTTDREYLQRLLEAIRRLFTGSATTAEHPREILACRVECPGTSVGGSLSIEFWTSPVSMKAFLLQERASQPNIYLRWGTGRLSSVRDDDTRSIVHRVFDTLPLSKLHILHFTGFLSRHLEPDQLGKLRSVRELCVDYTMSGDYVDQPMPGEEEAEFMGPRVIEGAHVPFPKLEHLALKYLQWHRHPLGRPGTCAEDVVYDIQRVLSRRKAAGEPLKLLNLSYGINVYEEEVRALVRDGLVDAVEGCDTSMSSECPVCTAAVEEPGDEEEPMEGYY